MLEVTVPGAYDEIGRELRLRCPLVRLGQSSEAARKLALSDTSLEAELSFLNAANRSASTKESQLSSPSSISAALPSPSLSTGGGVSTVLPLHSPEGNRFPTTPVSAAALSATPSQLLWPSLPANGDHIMSRKAGIGSSGYFGGAPSKNFWKADCKLVLGISSTAVSDPRKILKPRLDITILELLDEEDEEGDYNDQKEEKVGGENEEADQQRRGKEFSVSPDTDMRGKALRSLRRKSGSFQHGILVPLGGCKKSIELRVSKLKGKSGHGGKDRRSRRRRRRPEKHFEKAIRDLDKGAGAGDEEPEPAETKSGEVGVLSANIEVALD